MVKFSQKFSENGEKIQVDLPSRICIKWKPTLQGIGLIYTKQDIIYSRTEVNTPQSQ